MKYDEYEYYNMVIRTKVNKIPWSQHLKNYQIKDDAAALDLAA